MPVKVLLVVCLVLPACNGESTPDASPDVDNGTCGAMVRFTGEYVDWDSGAGFCGVFGARFQARDGGGTSNTAPNGRFDLCVPDQAVALVDVTPPSSASSCSMPADTYTMPAIAVATKRVFLAGAAWSGRAFVPARQATDPTKAQVFVHVHGGARKVALGAAHGATQVFTTAWAAGDTGENLYFPDVDPAGGETTLSADRVIAPERIPLVAGTMTLVTIAAR